MNRTKNQERMAKVLAEIKEIEMNMAKHKPYTEAWVLYKKMYDEKMAVYLDLEDEEFKRVEKSYERKGDYYD